MHIDFIVNLGTHEVIEDRTDLVSSLKPTDSAVHDMNQSSIS